MRREVHVVLVVDADQALESDLAVHRRVDEILTFHSIRKIAEERGIRIEDSRVRSVGDVQFSRAKEPRS